MPSTTLPHPVALRDDLLGRKQRAYDTYVAETTKRQTAEMDKERLTRELWQAERASAQGLGSESDVAAKEAELAQATEAYGHHLSRADAALDATKALDVQLDQLYGSAFPVFADEANEKSNEAEAVIDEFVDVYKRVLAAWSEATEAWAPLCQSVRLPGVSPFPLTEYRMQELIAGQCDPRPDGIELLKGDGFYERQDSELG
jgi:hypothetical protein